MYVFLVSEHVYGYVYDTLQSVSKLHGRLLCPSYANFKQHLLYEKVNVVNRRTDEYDLEYRSTPPYPYVWIGKTLRKSRTCLACGYPRYFNVYWWQISFRKREVTDSLVARTLNRFRDLMSKFESIYTCQYVRTLIRSIILRKYLSCIFTYPMVGKEKSPISNAKLRTRS